MHIQSYAKINLFLNITGVDPSDGYHFIDSLFQEVTLYDDISIDIDSSRKRDAVIFEKIEISGISTVEKALRLFKERFEIRDGFFIKIKKNIPAGAGLGGGSSNAAYALMAMADSYGIRHSEVADIGTSIGSDVPYFFKGGLCRVQGKGEAVHPLKIKLENIWFIIVYPGISVSTKWAYSLLDSYEKRDMPKEFSKISAINVDFLEKIVYNKFHYFVLKNNNELSMIVKGLESILNSRFSFMSGSGSSFVFVYDDKYKAEKDLELLNNQYSSYKAFLCDPLYR